MSTTISTNLFGRFWCIGLGVMAILGIVGGLAIGYPWTSSIPTEVFDRAVASRITFARPMKIRSGPTALTAGLSAATAWLFSVQIQLDFASVAAVGPVPEAQALGHLVSKVPLPERKSSAHLMSAGSWTAIAAVRTPTACQWSSSRLGVPIGREETADIGLVARSLQSFARLNGASLVLTRYAADFPPKAYAIAVTTVALAAGAIRALNHGMLVFNDVPSVCAGLRAKTAWQCNGLVKPH